MKTLFYNIKKYYRIKKDSYPLTDGFIMSYRRYNKDREKSIKNVNP